MGCGRVENVGDNKHHDKGNCVCDVVRAILDIQNQATDECGECPTNCFLEPLGGLTNPARNNADTRVFMLLTKDGDPFKAFFRTRTTPNTGDCVSVFFRVESIFDNCCATLRVLQPLGRDGHGIPLVSDTDRSRIDLTQICEAVNFRSTNSCITVDLNCFCGIECIADVYLDVCD